ncbi:MAG: hypothetical protein KGL35_32200, partial [Bradyrhizobium sp.]|nr:hypothetical protein [Bradyrhizobium sp.]
MAFGFLGGALSGASAGSSLGPIGAIGGGILGALGGLFGDDSASAQAQAAQQAAQAQIAALHQGLGVQQNAGSQIQGYFQPQITQGQGATNLLGGYLGTQGQGTQGQLYSQFQNDPGFQAAMQQGINAANSSAAANGTLNSGGQLKDLYNWGNQFAYQQYQNRLQNLYQMAGLGTQAGAAAGNLGQQNANQQSGLYGQIGGAQAAGIMGAANIQANQNQYDNNMLQGAFG